MSRGNPMHIPKSWGGPVADSSNTRLDARIAAAAFAQFKCDTSHASEVDVLLDWDNSPKDRNEYMRDACVVLAAADSVERPAVERLVAALRDLVQACETLRFDYTAAFEDAQDALAEFGQQPTGDEQ